MEEINAQVSQDEILKKPELKKMNRIWKAFGVLALLVFALATVFFTNKFSLEIVLEGEQELWVEYGDVYEEPGVQPVIRGKWLLKNGITPAKAVLQSQTDLNLNELGKYTVTYTAQYLGWSAISQRVVRVVDTSCPVIVLKSSGETVLPGQRYEEEGYVAMDNHDGNLTDQVQRVERYGTVVYTVRDSSGNPASVERKIPYFDPEPPELILEKGESITIPCGTIYEEPGYSAKDNVDGEMTEDVAVVGEVIWYVPGTYPIVYTIADKFGNVTQKVRNVTVEGQPWPETIWPDGKVIYLTFDDGPGPDTIRLLNLLKQYGVKATFFVTGSGDKGELWRMYKEGHSIGMHTMTHDYENIYSSMEAFFRDLYAIQEVIYRNTGIRTTLMRFPGGGSNLISSFNEGIMTKLAQAVQDSGFQYFDWNVDSNDAGGALKKQTVVNNVIAGVRNQQTSIVLQHDIHNFSVDAVEDIIVWGLENGYRFLPLTKNSPTMHHTILN